MQEEMHSGSKKKGGGGLGQEGAMRDGGEADKE